MARRRKSTGNGKSKETKSEAKSSLQESDSQERGKNHNNSRPSASGLSPEKQLSPKETSSVQNEIDSSSTINQNENSLMPLDIQQMILGDLQNVGQGEEIIVSREGPGDTSEEAEEEMIGETTRQEEYEIHTEEDEEEELVLMNEEDGEENQYVIVVNADCDFEVTDDTSQEIVSIHNLSDFQEGSCEIITVVRESDYDSSQESVDGIEEGCGEDNINAVIGTVDGIHCVNISQYHSDDEISNHEETIETQEILAAENDTEADLTNNTITREEENTGNGNLELSEIVNQTHLESRNPSENTEMSPSFGQSNCKLRESADLETGMEVDEINDTQTSIHEISESTPIESNSKVKDDSSLSSLSQTNSNKCENSLDNNKTVTSNSIDNIIEQVVITAGLDIKEDKSDDKEMHPTEIITTKPKNIRETRRGRNRVKAAKNRNSNSKKKETENEINIEKDESKLNMEDTSFIDNIQEHKVTSNCSASETVLCENSTLESSDSATIKKENVSSSSMEYFPNQTDNEKEDRKLSSIKEEAVMKDEEDKQAFRSRSGSTDTTGSESGSNSGSSRRRSGRIRCIGTAKQKPAAVPVVTSTTTPPVPGYEPDKPVKVKSRWRRSSELEMGSSTRRQQELEVMVANARLAENVATPPPPRPPTTPPPPDALAAFQQLDINEYHTERSKSKEAKKMICDCTLTKEEIARGDLGCGEDCLNRLLMIECGSRCLLGERCANKRFQNLEYAKCEVFKTEMKGYGLRALEDIPVDTFLLEYVGEVLDPKEFRKRAKDYAKDKNQHYYFMALKSDSIIDATQKGNISRFINHSCDPNAETQKWTVNGELRIGFFSKRQISAGEEITFDYQLQRYGKEAQRCHCQTALCRGWIGEDPEKENKWSDLSGKSRERKEKERKKKEDKRKEKDVLDDIDLEEEIEKLVLKNRAQTLLLCRLMVRAETHNTRSQLLNILQQGETACLRLFLDYHGLRLIWSWMLDPATDIGLKCEILETLSKLPIQNKTMLQDSKVLSVVEKWATSGLTVAEAKDRSSTEDETDKGELEKIKGSECEKNSDDSNESPVVESEEQQESNKKKIIELSNMLLQEWASLKEVFRIPKKERIEQMKEHEREADSLVFRESSVEKQDKSYDRHWSRSDYDRREKDRDKDRKRGRGDSPDSDKSRKSAKTDDRQSQMSKMERRQLFAIKAAQEEEERLRRQQENMWQEQVHLAAQELAAQQANSFPPPGFPPPPHQWMYPAPDGTGLLPQHLEAQPMFGPNSQHPPPPFFSQNGPHPPFLDPNHNSPFHPPLFSHPPPLPKPPLLPTPPPLPGQPFLHTPPLPGQPHPLNLPQFSQPPLPTQPPPPLTTQPPTSLPYPVHEAAPQFQTIPQSQFSQPPPFSQPPLPTQAPAPSPLPVFQAPLPSQAPAPSPLPVFQPPLPSQAPAPSPLPVFQVPLPAQLPPSAVVPVTTSAVSPVPLYLPVKLPPKWKSAKDAEGRTYYYHVKTRVSQWEPPLWDYQQHAAAVAAVQESESETESSDSDDDDDDSSADEKEEEDKNEEETEPAEGLNDDDLGCEELADSPYEPETMELLEDIEDDPKKKRKDILVQERIISPRTADEIPDKLDKKKIRELKEKLRRQKAKEKSRQKLKNKLKSRSVSSKCEADTSSDPGRKIKDAFRLNMAGVIVHYLNAYRKPDCKLGKITNTEDFKHLARKLTHFVMLKELKHCRSVDELECNDNVKHKARDFIKKYMAKFGSTYSRPADDD